ncbi:MAG: tRNA-binding protein [Spirochaetaceae bacterium]
METIGWKDFEKVELRVGTVVKVEDFPEARNPSYKVYVDFGEELGIKKTSAQVTALYTKAQLTGIQVIGVINFPSKQIGGFMSEFLLTGFYEDEGAVVLAVPERKVENGKKLL